MGGGGGAHGPLGPPGSDAYEKYILAKWQK